MSESEESLHPRKRMVEDSKVNVLVCWHWDPFDNYPGGIGRFIEDFIRYAPDSFEFTIFVLTARKLERFRKIEHTIAGKECRIVPVIVGESRARQLVPLRLKYVYAIRQYMRKHPIEKFVIHYHGIEPYFGLTNDSSNARVLFIHTNPGSRWKVRTQSRWRLFPSVLYYALERRVFARTDQVFFVNEQCFEEYVEKYPDRASDMELISTWIDPKNFFPPRTTDEVSMVSRVTSRMREELGFGPNTKVVFYFGRFEKIKDPLLLIDAFRYVVNQVEDCHLLLVGDGSLKNDMIRFVNKLSLTEAVTIMDRQDRRTIRDLLWMADVSVLPSHNEGMSMAVNESLACGCPVVGFDVGEIRKVMVPGESGEIVYDRTSEGLAEGIIEVIKRNEKYGRSREKCSERVIELIPEKVLEPVYRKTKELSQKIEERQSD